MNSETAKKISAAFAGGEIVTRELRLTDAEADDVARHCPVRMVPLGGDWYEITFLGSVKYAG